MSRQALSATATATAIRGTACHRNELDGSSMYIQPLKTERARVSTTADRCLRFVAVKVHVCRSITSSLIISRTCATQQNRALRDRQEADLETECAT
jgi:hypothetical protein